MVEFVSPPSPIPADQGDVARSEVRQRFEALARQWKDDSRRMGTVRAMVQHPAYQQIIGLGDVAVPLLLREMERAPDHWFAALKAITAVNPVPEEHRGDLPKMAESWIRWGRENGHWCDFGTEVVSFVPGPSRAINPTARPELRDDQEDMAGSDA